MKKAFLFFTFIAMALLSTAQSNPDKLKDILKSHTVQDTFRVNRLNELAANDYLVFEEQEKYATEALTISDKINYTLGRGNALVLLGVLKNREGNPGESKTLFMQADSIAKKTGDAELQASVLWRSSYLLQDENERMHQLHQADSIAKKTGNYYLRARILSKMATETSDTKEQEKLLQQIASLAQKTGDLDKQAEILYRLGYSPLLSINNNKALDYLLQAEQIFRQSGNKKALCEIQLNIGNIYELHFSDYAKAMEYYLKGLHAGEEANDQKSLIWAWTSLGGLYAEMGDQTTALTYLLKIENAIQKLGDKEQKADLQFSMGDSYRLSDQYPEAIKAYNKSIELTTNPVLIFLNQSNLADVYTRMGNLPLAFQYALTSLKGAKKKEAVRDLAWIDGILSRAYLKKNMADSAIYYANLGLQTAKQFGTIKYMRDNTLALSNAYAFKKDFEKAYNNRILYMSYRDSMMNEEVRNRTAVQHYTFNLDKKQLQIATLNDQKKYQQNLLIGAIILLFLILAAALLLLYNNRQKQKANKLLHHQKQEIDKKAGELATQKDNVELLSAIGRKITSSLSVDKISSTVYDNVNTLMDANVFGIGIYNDALERIEFPATYENGKPLPFYTNEIEDKNRFGSVCFSKGEEIIIGNLDEEYKNYIQEVSTPHAGGQPVSIIFLPLITKGEKLGVITVQSFKEKAYTDYHLFMLRNIATYTAIAIENAESYDTLNQTVTTLKSTQKQLIQSEKMASLGELTAGIAHEIQNPLNFVNNFSEVNHEMLQELKTERLKPIVERDDTLEDELLNDLIENSEKINHHGKRADAIVKGMLQHSRTSSGVKEPTDINALCDEYLRLSYHGLRAKDKNFNAEMKTDFDGTLQKINISPQDIGRVLLNLFNNAFYACTERSRSAVNLHLNESFGQEQKSQNLSSFDPIVSVTTKKSGNSVLIIVSDNGNGISQNIIDKIFQPFFTTKPTGQGTGLGLSLAYDIVKAHGGEIKVESKEGEGSTFIIQLPTV